MEPIKNNQRKPLIGMTLDQLQGVAVELGLPAFTAKQLANWLYVKRAASFDDMLNISKKGREALSQRYVVGRTKPSHAMRSQDGTVKYLFPVGDDMAIEAVYIPDDDRATLCISSQKGCRMNCYFCMTGRQGFHGNLTAAQIINQVLSIPDTDKLTNVVFMGMGEPLDNLMEVMKVIEILTAPWGFAWSPKRITVSTVGVKPALKTLVEQTSVHIAVSVHNAVEEERQQMMPIENIYPIKDVLAMLADYDFAHQRRLSVEYIMWQWFNDDYKHAEALREILPDEHVRVNIIRYHMIPDVPKLRTASNERMEAFRDYLNSRGVTCTIRRSRGEDISAACGMLAGELGKVGKGLPAAKPTIAEPTSDAKTDFPKAKKKSATQSPVSGKRATATTARGKRTESQQPRNGKQQSLVASNRKAKPAPAAGTAKPKHTAKARLTAAQAAAKANR